VAVGTDHDAPGAFQQRFPGAAFAAGGGEATFGAGPLAQGAGDRFAVEDGDRIALERGRAVGGRDVGARPFRADRGVAEGTRQRSTLRAALLGALDDATRLARQRRERGAPLATIAASARRSVNRTTASGFPRFIGLSSGALVAEFSRSALARRVLQGRGEGADLLLGELRQQALG
jgi:hypothetical protein